MLRHKPNRMSGGVYPVLSCKWPNANASSQYLNEAKKGVVGSTLGRLTVMLLMLAAQLAYWTRSTTDFHVGNELYSSKAHEVINVSHLSCVSSICMCLLQWSPAFGELLSSQTAQPGLHALESS